MMTTVESLRNGVKRTCGFPRSAEDEPQVCIPLILTHLVAMWSVAWCNQRTILVQQKKACPKRKSDGAHRDLHAPLLPKVGNDVG